MNKKFETKAWQRFLSKRGDSYKFPTFAEQMSLLDSLKSAASLADTEPKDVAQGSKIDTLLGDKEGNDWDLKDAVAWLKPNKSKSSDASENSRKFCAL